MTREQLISNAAAKGAKVEFSTKRSLDVPLIGICFFGHYVYHWFVQLGEDVYFDHSYSMNTGKTKKGLRHRMRVNTSLGAYN